MKEKLENVRKKSSSLKRLLKEVTKIFFFAALGRGGERRWLKNVAKSGG